MHIIASLLAAILPMLFYLIIIWRFDRYDREPFGLLLQNYFWGAIGAIIFALLGSSILETFISIFVSDPTTLNHITTIFVAPFVEETTKGIFLLITVLNKKFDNITDGIVYGGAIGLGFGMTENFLYFLAFGHTAAELISIVIIRTLFSAVMHCVATATFGAFVGYAKFKSLAYKFILPFVGLLIAIFIHFAWNFSVSFESTALLGFIFMAFTVIVFIAAFSLAILSEKKIIYRELLEEAQSGVLPPEHINILNSNKRNRFGWVDESIRKLYIRAATTLAFRKMQYKNTSGSKRNSYEKEIQHYRIYIQTLLANTRLN